MKLRSPRTAPKDKLILAVFDNLYYPSLLHLTQWDKDYQRWRFVRHKYGMGSGEIETDYKDEESLSGWINLPQINFKGNVVW